MFSKSDFQVLPELVHICEIVAGRAATDRPEPSDWGAEEGLTQVKGPSMVVEGFL